MKDTHLGLAGRQLALAGLLSSAAVAFGQVAPATDAQPSTVVFVCEHGNVKSLIAREWFNKLARARGLRVTAVSRGVTPEAKVPPLIAEALLHDGFDVSAFEPRPFSASDATKAVRVVAIGGDLTSSAERGDTPLDTWQGIPPASEDYVASRNALRDRIEALLDALQSRERPR